MTRAGARTRPSRWLAGASGLVGALAAAGCAAGTSPRVSVADPATTAPGTTQADCLAPQVLADLGLTEDDAPHADVPEPSPLPEGFSPVSAVLCSSGETLTDAQGRWAAVTASYREGDLQPLLDALDVPAPTVSCDVDQDVRYDLWLVDALGAGRRVALPGGACADLAGDVGAALDDLTEVDVVRYPVELVQPGARPTP